MPTLSAMFRLMDGYSSTIKKIVENTDKAAAAILGASKKTDRFNDSLKKTDTAASMASTGLGKLIGTIGGFAAAKKVMDLTDTYTNTNARLSMITKNMEEQKDLQNEIFAAANRARGSYTEMANASAKLKMLAGDSFGSNQEAVGFAELLTKSLKVSGASQTEQNSAFLQLTQAMTSGKLQGDEFRSVMENAPMVADAIAKYMGKSKGELKELSSQGLITSDIIKNAMFMAADDIDDRFSKMPMTFADIGQLAANGMQRAFSGAMEYANAQLNKMVGLLVQGGPIMKTFFTTAIIMAGLWAGKMLIAAGATLAAYWPLALIVGIVAAVILGVTSMGVTFADVLNYIGTLLGVFYATGYNIVANLWNIFVSFAEFLANVFNDPLAAVVNLFVNMATSVLSIIQSIAKAIDDVFGTNLASAVQGFSSKIQAWGDSFKPDSYVSLDDLRMDTKDIVGTAGTWGEKGKEFGNFIDNWDFGSVFNADGSGGMDFSQFATGGNPATVKGTGKGGAVKVESEEDLDWMRKLAERDYVARIAQNTLAPNIKVEFSGPITKEADTDGVMSRVVEQLKDVIATAPEGVPT